MNRLKLLLTTTSVLTAVACSSDPPRSCSLADPVDSCSGGQVCEEVSGQPTCVAPVVVRGRVLDPGGAAVAGARVTALDANDAPATGTTISGNDGSYELRVPVPRDDKGTPTALAIKLRASAARFQTFPGGLRRSLPIELGGASASEGKLVLRNSATDIVLDPVANPAGLGSISGTVQGPPGKRGVLVVAEGPVAASAVSDLDGAYVIFNVPAGHYTVSGYAAGVSLRAATVQVAAGSASAGVDLAELDLPPGKVSGSVSIVNAPGGSMTSVVLVVASTFDETLKRGEVPPGLRAPRAGVPSVSGAFAIEDVPDGQYVVLAAFENDGLVRDPDQAIGGTQIQRVTVGEGKREVTLASGFKITGALQIMSPGASDVPDAVTGIPTFVWRDDSSEDGYGLQLYDAKGTLVWSNEQIAKGSGGEVRVIYGGPPLTRGVLYQFRVTSYRKGNTVPISQSEDLRGVFLAQ